MLLVTLQKVSLNHILPSKSHKGWKSCADILLSIQPVRFIGKEFLVISPGLKTPQNKASFLKSGGSNSKGVL